MSELRSHKEFQKQTQDAHSCSKSDGKIFCILIDKIGLTRCAYVKVADAECNFEHPNVKNYLILEHTQKQ